jgi:predicted TPR repeat methyltransferase
MKPLLLLVLLLAAFVFCDNNNHNDESPEMLFRRTVSVWQQSNYRKKKNWTPWWDFCAVLLERFENTSDSRNRLELVGALEEGILVIEQATLGDGQDLERDAAISRLYHGYGHTLSLLTANECLQLALDSHTLLIGADTVKDRDHQVPPSTHLCIENAENALRNAVTLDATNSKAEALLRHITGEGSSTVHKRKPKEFVAELFDSFADSFDEKLGSLGYKVPRLVGETVQRLNPSPSHSYRSALDAGCGTGLAGRFLRPLVKGPMIGVDASQNMLDIAAKCTTSSGCGITDGATKDDNNNDDNRQQLLYEGLLALDLEDMTLENTLGSYDDVQGFELVVAADVLVYFGHLDNLLQTFASLSTPGASLVFSCERATFDEAPLGWRLLSSGRFAHTKNHVVEAAAKAGYELVTYEEIVPRMERGEEVRGHLFGLKLTGSGRRDAEL